MSRWRGPGAGPGPDAGAQVAGALKAMETCLGELETVWLAGGEKRFLAGDTISVGLTTLIPSSFNTFSIATFIIIFLNIRFPITSIELNHLSNLLPDDPPDRRHPGGHRAGAAEHGGLRRDGGAGGAGGLPGQGEGRAEPPLRGGLRGGLQHEG